MAHLTSAEISDSAVAHTTLVPDCKRRPWVKRLFADGAYGPLKLMDKASYLDFVLEIIRRLHDTRGFKVLPRRWASSAPSAG